MSLAEGEKVAIELEPVVAASAWNADALEDRRVRMPEPLPVRLVTVEDAHRIAACGLERELDAFYVELLGFERQTEEGEMIYQSENARLIFDVTEPPVRRVEMRPLGIEVQSLAQAEHQLMDAGIVYRRQRGLLPGLDSLLLQDPAGNWIELTASSRV